MEGHDEVVCALLQGSSDFRFQTKTEGVQQEHHWRHALIFTASTNAGKCACSGLADIAVAINI